MKNLKRIYIILLLFISFTATSQVFIGELEEIYLGYEEVTKNDFDSLNNDIKSLENFKFRKALKEARRTKDSLEFVSNRTKLHVSQEEYLKTLRKAANRSSDSTEFIDKLSSQFPELKNVIATHESFEELYEIVRPVTFNGWLEELPSFF